MRLVWLWKGNDLGTTDSNQHRRLPNELEGLVSYIMKSVCVSSLSLSHLQYLYVSVYDAGGNQNTW